MLAQTTFSTIDDHHLPSSQSYRESNEDVAQAPSSTIEAHARSDAEPAQAPILSTAGHMPIETSTGFPPDGSNPVATNSSTQSPEQMKTKSSMIYHHKQRHIHKPHSATKARTKSPASHDTEMQALNADESDEDAWTDPVRYITTHEMGKSFLVVK
jgi:hypothetical protein